MNIQSFYEYVILRDILAFMLPGGISLAGIYMVAQVLGYDRWQKNLPFLSEMNPFLSAVLLILIAFLIGHVWDMAYRLYYQKKPQYQREDTIRKILIGDDNSSPRSITNHIATEIREATGEFLRIDWGKTHVDEWVKSGRAFEASILLSYWIEEEDPKLFGTEIGRPIVQSHLLHVSGMAFKQNGALFLLLGVVDYLIGAFQLQFIHPFAFCLLGAGLYGFGQLLLNQGIHKRDVILEHVFRVFYVVWRKRVLENKSGIIKKEPASGRIGKNRGSG